MKYLLSLAILIIVISCQWSDKKCLTKNSPANRQGYKAEGCFIGRRETGKWFFYDSLNRVIENGNFEDGIRIGEWRYPLNKSDSVIKWEKYEKEGLDLILNIPSAMKVVEDSSSYVKFSNLHTTVLANVIVAVHKPETYLHNARNYYKQNELDIESMGWTYNAKRTKLYADDDTLYFQEYEVHVTRDSSFKILDIYGLMKDREMIEIICRYSPTTEHTARTVFFSVVSNLFYRKNRFVNILADIDYIETE